MRLIDADALVDRFKAWSVGGHIPLAVAIDLTDNQRTITAKEFAELLREENSDEID